MCMCVCVCVCREKLDRVYDKLKFKRQEESVLAADCTQLSSRLNAAESERRALEATVDDLSLRKTEAERQVQDQAEKLQRARRTVARAAQALGVSPADAAAPASKEATLAEMSEVARAMASELAALAAQYPEARIAEVAEQCGVRLPAANGLSTPTRGGGGGASRPMSARSGGSRPGSRGSAAAIRTVQVNI